MASREHYFGTGVCVRWVSCAVQTTLPMLCWSGLGPDQLISQLQILARAITVNKL